ncbi:hypothetical protein [Rathayibacter soli]|uniref:hypothetical protein n=1 Tax=Rathayibacter soli TaxID=3144168 RepID=UPI0027E5AC33|nr:hypothetical protein [Glaciibacter superstes]
MYPLPLVVWMLVITGVIGLPALTVVALARGTAPDGLRRTTPARLAWAAGIGWTLWAIASTLLAAAGVYRLTWTATNPAIGVAALGAMLVAFLFTRMPAASRILTRPELAWRVTLPHALRIAGGAAFLAAFALGALPAVFALPAGFGDIAIGIEAIFLSARMRRGVAGRGVLWFNILGLLDLAYALTAGFLAGPGPVRLLTVVPSTAPVALLPLVLIPTVIVPLAVILHVVSLTTLRATARASRSGTGSRSATVPAR